MERFHRKRTDARYALYNPLKLAARDANVCVLGRTIARRCRFEDIPIWREVMMESELVGCDQLRLTLSDPLGAMQCGIAVYRADPFTRREQRRLSRWTRAIRQRILDDELMDAVGLAYALDAVLEEVVDAAVIVDRRGVIRAANHLARRRLCRRSDDLQQTIAAILRRPDRAVPGTRVIRIAGGTVEHLLILIKTAPPAVDTAAAHASNRWGLSSRQAEILAYVLRGHANKTIAARLECSEKNVEYHLRRIMERAQVSSRTEVAVAAFSPLHSS
jgi:DNA-binding NarL/FixJ family response regulator